MRQSRVPSCSKSQQCRESQFWLQATQHQTQHGLIFRERCLCWPDDHPLDHICFNAGQGRSEAFNFEFPVLVIEQLANQYFARLNELVPRLHGSGIIGLFWIL